MFSLIHAFDIGESLTIQKRTVMNREVKKFHAFAFVIALVTLAVIISIFPLRIWNDVRTEVGGGFENGYTQGVD